MRLRARLSNLWYRMRGTCWFIPGLPVLMAVTLAFATTALSGSLRWQDWVALRWIYSGGR